MGVKKQKKLRSGYTTGACAAAAALGAALMLERQREVESVDLVLPAGVSASFKLNGRRFSDTQAACFVVKDAGDDPDVTDGVEVHALVERIGGDQVLIRGGTGVGTVTKPGLPVAIGEPAINPVPRKMIEQSVRAVFAEGGVAVTISIPDGERRAQKTLNERLGIVGGLSILGTTGIVRPVSHQAWTDTIDVAIDVALASGCETVAMVTGRTSEQAAQRVLDLAEEAFVMMGDHVGYAMQAGHRKGVPRLLVAAQFAKLLKIACGHRQTHVHSSRLDLSQLALWAREAGLDASAVEKIECANTAREVLTDHPSADRLARQVSERARINLNQWAGGVPVAVMLVDYNGMIVETDLNRNEKDAEP